MMWVRLRERVLLEDDAILVLDKPVGVSVMGERHDSDVVRMAAEAGETLYPVHRIDKVTSGVVLFAKDLAVHGGLTRQFNKRTVEKTYLAVATPGGLPATGRIELPLSVGRKNRVRIAAPRERIEVTDGVYTVPPDAVFDEVTNYPSVTSYTIQWQDETHALMVIRPLTGRRHQIRVHLAWIGHPIVNDPLFAKNATGRAHLHAWQLSFDHAGDRVTVNAPPDDEFFAPLPTGVGLAIPPTG